VDDGRGGLKAEATDEFETIPVGLVFRSVGYRGVALPGVPFHDAWGTIPNEKGRILTQHKDGQVVPGEYVVGWIKRGPSGVIGTNKPDSVETANMLLEDLQAGRLLDPPSPSRESLEKLLTQRNACYVTYDDWLRLDAFELKRGEAQGRPRLKFCDVQEMLAALGKK
jgi:ferredoxin--NADP+ reductase